MSYVLYMISRLPLLKSEFFPILGEHVMHDFAQTSRKMATVLVLFLAHLIKTPGISYVDSHSFLLRFTLYFYRSVHFGETDSVLNFLPHQFFVILY